MLCDAELAGAFASVRGRVSKQTICAGSRKSLSVSEAARDFVDETMESMESEPQRRICRNDQVRTIVNGLLATGASYAQIVRALGDDNAALDKCDRVTIDSTRNHATRHFPVQQVARATYREIVERRAQEAEIDFVNGGGHGSHADGLL